MKPDLLAELGNGQTSTGFAGKLALRSGRSSVVLSRYPSCGFPAEDLDFYFPVGALNIPYPTPHDLADREWDDVAVTIAKWVSYFRPGSPVCINPRSQNVRRFRFEIEDLVATLQREQLALQNWLYWAFKHLPSAPRWKLERWWSSAVLVEWAWAWVSLPMPAAQDWRTRCPAWQQANAQWDQFVEEWWRAELWHSTLGTRRLLANHFPFGLDETMRAYRDEADRFILAVHDRALHGAWIWWLES